MRRPRAQRAFPAEFESKPNGVTEDELRAAAGRYSQIDEVRPAFIHANPMPMPDAPFPMPVRELDDKGRMKLPAFLLSGHKASG
ncbi:MAG: hypothetical protein JHC67_13190 [Mycolicibacterium sp.]|nr:hypothetical protein [Mycolicibacterium sp.]